LQRWVIGLHAARDVEVRNAPRRRALERQRRKEHAQCREYAARPAAGSQHYADEALHELMSDGFHREPSRPFDTCFSDPTNVLSADSLNEHVGRTGNTTTFRTGDFCWSKYSIHGVG
jgi:hypothetical protein